ncbi:MAG: DsrE family protein [Gammaproteobacteria bacterium]|nr:DsrE family protein [Gammaproteobacteria bacterium]
MKLFNTLLMVSGLLSVTGVMAAPEELAPYGTAKTNMHTYAPINRVFDVNYEDPANLNALYGFITNIDKVVPGKSVVVLHGPEMRVFAKENYLKFQGIVDKMAELSKQGTEFRMCNNAMHAAGFKAEDMDGFITVIPAGFAEIIDLESKGYQPINPLVTAVKDSRYIEHPEKKPAN